MEALVLERHEAVAVLRLNCPQTRNALTAEIKAGLGTMVPRLMADATVGCLVLTGTGQSFCAGGDLRAMQDRAPDAVRHRMRTSYAWVRLLLEGDTPVIAAVNGAAAGAGFSLALLCDIVLMADDAYVQPSFPAIGAVPDLGLALTLPRAIGMARARALLLTNRRVGAPEAVAMGLAAKQCPASELMDQALAMAQSLAAGPRRSLGLTKRLLNQAFGPLDGFLETEAELQAQAFGTADFAEGVDAFLGKRRPVFGKR